MTDEAPSILITDDDEDFRETLREVFEPRGFRALLAADGCEALTIVQQESVHLLLLDMHMPRLDGLSTIRQVKQTHGVLPCILLSARMDAALAAEATRAQVFSCVSKPVSFRELTRIVQEALRITYDWTYPPRGS